MQLQPFGYGYAGELQAGFDEAVRRLKDALAKQGFGVQAEIPISTALKDKLGVSVPREVIFGVCNPSLAYQAMQMEPEITVLLPCTIAVRETSAGVHIGAANAKMLVELTANPDLEPIAAEAEKKLMAALGEL